MVERERIGHDSTIEQLEVLALNDALKDNHHTLWGHGTPSFNSADSFFREGIHQRKSSPFLGSTAIPICEENISVIDNWPHKPHNDDVNVVLLAIPDAAPHDGVLISDIDKHVIRYDSDSDAFIFPPEDIVGMYDAQHKIMIPNPFFAINADSYSRKISTIQNIKSADSDRIANMKLRRPSGGHTMSRVAIDRTIVAPRLKPSQPIDNDTDIW